MQQRRHGAQEHGRRDQALAHVRERGAAAVEREENPHADAGAHRERGRGPERRAVGEVDDRAQHAEERDGDALLIVAAAHLRHRAHTLFDLLGRMVAARADVGHERVVKRVLERLIRRALPALVHLTRGGEHLFAGVEAVEQRGHHVGGKAARRAVAREVLAQLVRGRLPVAGRRDAALQKRRAAQREAHEEQKRQQHDENIRQPRGRDGHGAHRCGLFGMFHDVPPCCAMVSAGPET